jgi:GntR family transcriptional regulator, rspAB operon transcriptional repressor
MSIATFKSPRDLDASRPAAEMVFEDLRERIVRLDLAPGSAINRQALQVQYGLSSTPVRDALTRLSEEGLVEIVPQSATRVSLIDIAAARQAQFLRRAVEQEALRILCALPDRDFVPELRALITRQRTLVAAQDHAGFVDLDYAFHSRMVELAGAPDLFQLVRRHGGHLDRIRRLHLPVPGKMREILREHGLIVKAIEVGDAAAAQAHLRDHLSRSLAYAVTLKAEHPHYFRD